MSFIIQGINLPKKDEVMVITVWGNDREGTAFISNKEPYITVPINAVQIPKEHGRIGDLDKLQNAIKTDIMGGLNYEHFIRNASVILEAEGEE